jgi:hypothetical protein
MMFEQLQFNRTACLKGLKGCLKNLNAFQFRFTLETSYVLHPFHVRCTLETSYILYRLEGAWESHSRYSYYILLNFSRALSAFLGL